MSAVIKSITPFLEKELLLQALTQLQLDHHLSTQYGQEKIDILAGRQHFIFEGGRYKLVYEDDISFTSYAQRGRNQKSWRDAAAFLKEVELAYNERYDLRLAELIRQQEEAERLRIEEERRQYVQQQKESILQKAQEQGYEVKEKMVGTKIQLVLVKHTY